MNNWKRDEFTNNLQEKELNSTKTFFALYYFSSPTSSYFTEHFILKYVL